MNEPEHDRKDEPESNVALMKSHKSAWRTRTKRASLSSGTSGIADTTTVNTSTGRAAFSAWWPDVSAGLVVFLVALPLCLGVALASGAPLMSGIITGVIGGIIVSFVSGSQLMVSGPAAGLTAIVLTAIATLGSFSAFLVAVVLAGILQMILGMAKAGIIAYFFPSAVVKGMLAGIGLILISKQLPYALGFGAEVFESSAFINPAGGTTFTAIADAFANVQPASVGLSVFALVMLALWDGRSFARLRKLLPGPLAVVVVGVLVNIALEVFAPSFALGQESLVTLPLFDGTSSLSTYLMFPNWSHLANPAVYTTAITIAIVASIETLLSLEATDKLDPYKRSSPANRELFAQGIGNTIAGLVGGLPMTGVIVRSATNIDAGGRTRMASFWHGTFLLFAILAIPFVLNRIPLAVLAAILIYTGYKLAHPRLFRDAYRIGYKHLIPLVVTVVAILATDLLVGIGVGVVVGTFFVLLNNYRTAYFYQRDESDDHQSIWITLSEDVSFLNKASINHMLRRLPENSRVTIDGSVSQHIDTDIVEILREFVETAKLRNIDFRLVGIPDLPLFHQLH